VIIEGIFGVFQGRQNSRQYGTPST